MTERFETARGLVDVGRGIAQTLAVEGVNRAFSGVGTPLPDRLQQASHQARVEQAEAGIEIALHLGDAALLAQQMNQLEALDPANTTKYGSLALAIERES